MAKGKTKRTPQHGAVAAAKAKQQAALDADAAEEAGPFFDGGSDGEEEVSASDEQDSDMPSSDPEDLPDVGPGLLADSSGSDEQDEDPDGAGVCGVIWISLVLGQSKSSGPPGSL